MIETYKVLQDGTEVDGVVFNEGELLEIDTDTQNVSEQLAEGTVQLVTDEDESDASEEGADNAEPTDSEVSATEEGTGLFFDGSELTAEAVNIETDGVFYKQFSTVDGKTYKLPVDEYNEKVKPLE